MGGNAGGGGGCGYVGSTMGATGNGGAGLVIIQYRVRSLTA
jgi:hypothetical protein